MSYEITTDDLPDGYAASAAREGEKAQIVVREFSSSEDGDNFIKHLEGFVSPIIGLLPSGDQIRCSMIDNLLMIRRRDNTATVYVNELNFLVKAQIKRNVKAGDAIFTDDIADIHRLSIMGVEVPADAGVLFLYSIGWRKGLFFDFRPLLPNAGHRDFDIEILLGQYHAYLAFQHLFKITDEEWKTLLAQQWFPFTTLKHETIRSILGYVRSGWGVDDLIPKISEEVKDRLPTMLKKWEVAPLFKPHHALLRQAAERFLQDDYISATSILYPRIEGIMRTYHLNINKNAKPSQKHLVSSVIESGTVVRHSHSLLLPAKFRLYLARRLLC